MKYQSSVTCSLQEDILKKVNLGPSVQMDEKGNKLQLKFSSGEGFFY